MTVSSGLYFPGQQAWLSLAPSHQCPPPGITGLRAELGCCRPPKPHQALHIGTGHNCFFTRRRHGFDSLTCYFKECKLPTQGSAYAMHRYFGF